MKKNIKRFLQNLEIQNKDYTTEINKPPLLGIDLGEKFCGLAFSPDGVSSFPLLITPFLELRTSIEKIKIKKPFDKIIIGLPLNENGSENEWCEKIRIIGDSLNKYAPIEYINERNTSKESIFSGSKKERHDDLAAAKILEYYIDSIK